MIEFNFYLSEEDFNRVDAIKQLREKKDYTFNDMAKELLEERLFQLFPASPTFDEDMRVTNPEKYRGSTPESERQYLESLKDKPSIFNFSKKTEKDS